MRGPTEHKALIAAIPFVPRALAIPGSPEWCKSLLIGLEATWQRRVLDNKSWAEKWLEVEKHNVWSVFPPSKPFGTVDALLQFIGASREEVTRRLDIGQRLAADPEVRASLGGEELRRARAAGGKRGGRGNLHANSGKVSVGCTAATYIVRRLKRDAPEIAEALARGEYRSARAAGIAAGFVKVPSGLEVLRRAWARATKKERHIFLVEIGRGKNGGR